MTGVNISHLYFHPGVVILYILIPFLIDNHVRLHSSQNASYTEDVCDMHLRLTAKPHLCVICSTFHT